MTDNLKTDFPGPCFWWVISLLFNVTLKSFWHCLFLVMIIIIVLFLLQNLVLVYLSWCIVKFYTLFFLQQFLGLDCLVSGLLGSCHLQKNCY